MTIEEMLTYAYSNCGVSIDEFSELSFYEWGLLMERSRVKLELQAGFTGDIVAMIANTMRDHKKKPEPFKREDFYPFISDKNDSKVSEAMNPEDVEKKFGKLKSKIK